MAAVGKLDRLAQQERGQVLGGRVVAHVHQRRDARRRRTDDLHQVPGGRLVQPRVLAAPSPGAAQLGADTAPGLPGPPRGRADHRVRDVPVVPQPLPGRGGIPLPPRGQGALGVRAPGRSPALACRITISRLAPCIGSMVRFRGPGSPAGARGARRLAWSGCGRPRGRLAVLTGRRRPGRPGQRSASHPAGPARRDAGGAPLGDDDGGHHDGDRDERHARCAAPRCGCT